MRLLYKVIYCRIEKHIEKIDPKKIMGFYCMKTLRIGAVLMILLFLAASCSQNHYAKTKRKMTLEQKKDINPTAQRVE